MTVVVNQGMEQTLIHRRVEECRRGEYPLIISRMESGWAVMGEQQITPGYCLLLPDPVVPHLNAMNEVTRATFLRDMARLGDAVLKVTCALKINYEMLGNIEPALHAHVVPRYQDELEQRGFRSVFALDWSSESKQGFVAPDSILSLIADSLLTNRAV